MALPGLVPPSCSGKGRRGRQGARLGSSFSGSCESAHVSCPVCVRVFVTPCTVAHQAPRPWTFPGKNLGMGCHAILQGTFLTQGSNPGLLHCRQILYRLSHHGSPSVDHKPLQRLVSTASLFAEATGALGFTLHSQTLLGGIPAQVLQRVNRDSGLQGNLLGRTACGRWSGGCRH